MTFDFYSSSTFNFPLAFSLLISFPLCVSSKVPSMIPSIPHQIIPAIHHIIHRRFPPCFYASKDGNLKIISYGNLLLSSSASGLLLRFSFLVHMSSKLSLQHSLSHFPFKLIFNWSGGELDDI
jgi:hypothetical protein